jgi:hypothetical protein
MAGTDTAASKIACPSAAAPEFFVFHFDLARTLGPEQIAVEPLSPAKALSHSFAQSKGQIP